MRKLSVLAFFLMVLFAIQLLPAQDVEGYLIDILNRPEAEAKAYVQGYMQPLSTALGSSLGGGLYHRGYAKSFPRFDIGVSSAMILIPDEAKSFNSPITGGSDKVPTFFGKKKSSDPAAVIDGIDQKYFALPVLQANVGLFANLEATARFASWKITDVGKVGVYGGGLKYELSDLIPIPMFPIDFGVQALYHKFTIGEFLNAGTFSMNFQASGSIPVLPIDIYGGIGYDNSEMTINPKKLGSTLNEITVDGENSVRFNAGVSLTLLFFNIHADYNFGKYKALAGGVMIVL